MPEQKREIDFGFLFCQVSHFYSMSYQDVMAMPIRSFWLMSGNIRRLRADNDLRTLTTAVAAQNGEGAGELHERFVLEMGTVVNAPDAALDVERDEEGFAELKAMAAAM